MSSLQAVRGMQDLLPPEARRHRHIIETARAVASLYGYEDMATPVIEFTEVFKRPIGIATDIVAKEMYSFDDRSGDNLSLRPEGTAGIARAVISNGLTQATPLKYFYTGPMFRHERPQKGRYRQFHQIGIEVIGPGQPQADIEVIALGRLILERLDVLGSCTLHLNTLGDLESRRRYRALILDHLRPMAAELSEDSRSRLDTNPLRILDSKDEGDRRLVAELPSFAECLSVESADFFAEVRRGLDALGIDYLVDPRLVRGLDYYCHTAFEFVSDALGAQGTVLGGGRYDGLIGTLGGPEIPGIGWAAGIERLAMLIAEPAGPARPVAVVPIGDAMQIAALQLSERLRRAGWAVDMAYGGNVQKRMKRANKLGARFAIVLGEDEAVRNAVTLRDLDAGTQAEVALDDLLARLEVTR